MAGHHRYRRQRRRPCPRPGAVAPSGGLRLRNTVGDSWTTGLVWTERAIWVAMAPVPVPRGGVAGGLQGGGG